jgi:hypothetical protein
MPESTVKKLDTPPASQIVGFLGREFVNTANLYFAPVTAVIRTIQDVWVASGKPQEIKWQVEPTKIVPSSMPSNDADNNH